MRVYQDGKSTALRIREHPSGMTCLLLVAPRSRGQVHAGRGVGHWRRPHARGVPSRSTVHVTPSRSWGVTWQPGDGGPQWKEVAIQGRLTPRSRVQQGDTGAVPGVLSGGSGGGRGGR